MHFSDNYPTYREQALCQTQASIELVEFLPIRGARGKYPRRDNGQELPTGKNLRGVPPRLILEWVQRGFCGEQELRGQEAEELDNDPGRFLAVRVGHVFGFDTFFKQGFEIGGRGLPVGLR